MASETFGNVEIEMVDEGWDAVVKQVVETKCVPMMQKVADACNEADGLQGGSGPDQDQAPGYRAGTDGAKSLEKHDYRATAIAATYQAMARNAANNTLVNNFYQAEGE